MTRALGAIVFLVLAYTVTMLAAGHLPPSYAASAAFPLGPQTCSRLDSPRLSPIGLFGGEFRRKEGCGQ